MTKTILATAILVAFAGTASAETITAQITGMHDYGAEDKIFETTTDLGVGGLLNGKLTTTGSLTMTTPGVVLGAVKSEITAKDVTLTSKNSTAVSSYGTHTIKASNNITISAKEDAIQGQSDGSADSVITIIAGNELTVTSNKEAVQAMNGNIKLKAKKVTLISKTDQAIKQDGPSTTTIEAEHIDVQGFKEGTSIFKPSSILVNEGTLNLIASESLNVSTNPNKSAIKSSTGSTLVIDTPKATVNGDIAAKGETRLNGALTFNGKSANIANLTGDKATFTVTKADQKVAVTNNNKALTLAGNGDVNDAVGIEGMGNIVKLDGNKEGVKVQMAEGMSSAASSAVLDKNGNLTNVQTVTNSILSNTVDIYAGSTLALNRIMMSDLRKRMGDLRATEDVNGVWARYNGGKFSGARGLENKFTTVEVGADTAALVDGVRLGVALSYTDSESDMLRGKADMDAFSLAAYGTKFFDNGIYADVIGRIAKADTDVSVDGNKNGKMDNLAVSLSGELGWRFDLSKQIYIEPQTELTYTNIDSDTLKLSSGHEYKFDSVDSLIGRVGVATGIKCPNNKGDVYVRVSAVHEFLGDAKVTSGNDVYKVKGDDTWMEYGLGANFNINKNAYVYTELERSAGAALEQDWRANLGVRIAF